MVLMVMVMRIMMMAVDGGDDIRSNGGDGG